MGAEAGRHALQGRPRSLDADLGSDRHGHLAIRTFKVGAGQPSSITVCELSEHSDHEWLALDDSGVDVKKVADRVRVAVAGGMLTLRRDALMKLKRGITSVEEVLKETAADKL